jgi:hypothetical protein
MAILEKLVLTGKVNIGDLYDFPNDGIHGHIMKLASFLHGMDMGSEDSVNLIYGKFNQTSQRRELQKNEIENAVAKAYNSPGVTIKTIGKGEGILVAPKFVKTSEDSYWNTHMPLPKVEANQASIRRAIATTPWSLDDMLRNSPYRCFDSKPEEIINMLFEPDQLVCSGSVRRFWTLPAKEWLSVGNVGDQIVPNPSRVKVGTNLKGNPSQHCRDATGWRKYIVVESDDESLSFDEKASVLRYLRDRAGAELKMVVHTGGKSLHGWFKSTGDSHLDWEFMRVACLLGADRRMWLPEQLARTPNAVRLSNGAEQKCYHFDPS